MSFEKSVRNIDPAAYEEYWKELALYKGASKTYRKIHKLYKNSVNPAEKLYFYASKEIYSEASKRYSAARTKWENIVAAARIREHSNTGLSPDALMLRFLNIKVPKTVKDLAEMKKEEKLAEELASGKLKDIQDALLGIKPEAEATLPSEQEQFLHPTDEAHETRSDPTDGDFEPL